MTGFSIEFLRFDRDDIGGMDKQNDRFWNWPVTYVLHGEDKVYVGESQNVATRMSHHLANAEKAGSLREIRIVVDETFNKSVCLDLESTLIRWFAGDGRLAVLNRNDGITNADYYRRDDYQQVFKQVFDELRQAGLFERTIPAIENSDLFKLSPFKALNTDQAAAVESILEGLVEDLAAGHDSLSIVDGVPGTGKTVVGIYLVKLLRDIAEYEPNEDIDPDSFFAEFFVEDVRELFDGLRIGLVIPQQSLRGSVRRVFSKTPALRETAVLSPFDVGESSDQWDVLIVDEAHRLNQLAAQPHGTLTKKFKEITAALFGGPDESKTQLDWIRAKARHTILLLDTGQSVRPADMNPQDFEPVIDHAKAGNRWYPLHSQMRVEGGSQYIDFVRSCFSDDPPETIPDFGTYDFRVFDDLEEMVQAIRDREGEVGLSRLVAGYAWDWRSRRDKTAFDIEVGDVRLRWNVKQVDWINSRTSRDEVGSIHTVQGYDLNYAGVIIGEDIRRDAQSGRLYVDRNRYRDSAGKRNNPMRGRVTTDADLLRYIRNIYSTLMTRGIKGTYVYRCRAEGDPDAIVI